MKILKTISDNLHWYLKLCSYCHIRRAVWYYVPGTAIACDGCVPRGCTCHEYPLDGKYSNSDPANWTQDLDELGRKFPCVEWRKFYKKNSHPL